MSDIELTESQKRLVAKFLAAQRARDFLRSNFTGPDATAAIGAVDALIEALVREHETTGLPSYFAMPPGVLRLSMEMLGAVQQ